MALLTINAYEQRANATGQELARFLAESKRRERDRDLERLRTELAAVKAARRTREDEQKSRENYDRALQRIQERLRNHDLIRRLSQGDLRRRDDVYNYGELTRQWAREHHGGYICGIRNCLCGGNCDDEHGHRRRRSRIRRHLDHSAQQVNYIGPVYVEGCNSDSPYVSHADWPPVDVYKKRFGGLLPDKRLPWLTEDTFLDGNDIMRISKRRRRCYVPPCYH